MGTGYMKLRPVQAWALTEFFEQRGGVGVLGVGAGKTIVSLLAPVLLDWERPLLLVPAGLRDKTIKLDVPILSRHWKLPPILGVTGSGRGALEVRSYEELSQDNFSDYLSKRKIPDGLVCDEVHKLARRGAGRTKRINRFFSEFPTTEMIALSGTLVHRSVFDYGHITNFALKDTSPLPHSALELRTWADCLDSGIAEHVRPHPGAMMDFCTTGETVRDGYRRRFLETPGIVSSPDLSTNIGLVVSEAKMPKVPKEIKEAFHRLRNLAELPPAPDGTPGEVCSTALSQTRHARELLHGFYYRWVWPGGVRDKEWLKKRKACKKYVRKMTARSHNGMWLDTEFQVMKAVETGKIVCSEDEMSEDGKILIRSNVDVVAEWIEIREDRRPKWNGKPEPPKEAVWLSDYMLEYFEEWADKRDKSGEAGIVWVESIAFLEKLRERDRARGVRERCFAAGENEIEVEDGTRTVFASLAHTTGKNLHMWHWMLFGNPLSSGKANEQALGREHRPGQLADDVYAEVVLGCRETWWSFERSKMDASYIESTLGQPQRLNKATLAIDTTEAVAVQRCDAGDPLWAETGFSRIDGMFGVIGKDGKRMESATPVLDAMKKAAKAGGTGEGGQLTLKDVMFDGEEEEDQEDSESDEVSEEEESDE